MWRVLLLLLPVFWCPSEAQNFYIAAPNVIRLGVEENIAIAVDGTNDPQQVEVYIQDHPGKRANISHVFQTVVPLSPKIVTVRVDPEAIPDGLLSDLSVKSYVSLLVRSGNFQKEMVLPLSLKSGYVFVQTDKPIYSPKQQVKFRIIQLNEDARPSHEEMRLQIINPKNVVVQETVYNGKHQKSHQLYVTPVPYKFPSYPLLGIWSVRVLYGYQFQQNTTTKFELEEYVLPFFTVKLKTKEVILPEDKSIRISVEAKFVYGKPVEGLVTFRLGVKGEAPEALFFAVLDSKKLLDGEYFTDVSTNELKQHKDVGWFPEIEGSHFVVEATITDIATGQKEVAMDARGRFSKSPFIISFKRCLNDFKPGLVSIIQADVKFVDGRPAARVKTAISAVANNNVNLKIGNPVSVSDEEGKVYFEIHPEVDHDIVTVTVKTDDPKYKGNQAVGHHTQAKFVSKNKAYIAITRRGEGTVKPGLFSELIHLEPAEISDIYYMVVSKGKIMIINKLPRGKFKIQRVEFMVTYDMAPSFRIVAFAEFKGELIADALKVEVVKECDPDAEVTVLPNFRVKEPGSNVKLSIKGNKDTRVGILAVDSAVYALSDKERLTKSKMFETMEKHDLGCGPGGGLTTDSVLRSAGVIMMTKTFSLDNAMISACEGKVRKKRQVVIQKLNDFQGRLRDCCALGINKDLYERSCEQRSDIVKKYLQDKDESCSQVFLDCCLFAEMEKVSELPIIRQRAQVGRKGERVNELEFILTENEDSLEREILTRNDFRETWLFSDINIGPDGKEELEVSLPHSITTWVVQAVYVSESHGMCVAAPQEVETFKKVFVMLNLPYSVVRKEQIEIRATVFNYGDSTLSAVVYMHGTKDLCSGAQQGEKSERKRLVVEAHSAQSVSFPVIPLKEGSYDIKIVALSPDGSDVIMKSLNVVPEGEVVEKDITVKLDPSNQQKRNKRHISTDLYSDSIDVDQKLQVTAIKLKAPEGYIHGTESCIISALGDMFGPAVQTSVENPDKFFTKPNGCGEQNMIHFAPTLYTMRYLKETGQMTPEKEALGYDLIRKGYSHQLTFRKDDGSFGAYLTKPSSTWLTAFVIKVFCQASRLVHVDENIMCSGVKWLADRQQEDGSFIEHHPVYHLDMMGGVKGQTPLTAFVLITLQECTCDIENIHIKRARALAYLEEHLGDVSEPLPVAVTAYALALSDSELKEAGNDKLQALGKFNSDSNTLHWGTGSSAADVEVTSYGLLTQLQFNDMEKSNAIVNWLNTKSLASGSFPSTQDTVIALQALSEYAIRARTPGISLVSNITSSNDKNFLKTMAFHEKNSLILQEVKVDKLGGMLFINTGGHGVGLLSVKLRYNIPYPEAKLCKFEIKVNVSEEKENQGGNDNPVVIKPHGADVFQLFPDDLIRGAKNALDAPPENIAFDLDPRNRLPRSPRFSPVQPLVKSASEGEGNRVKREDKMENSNLVFKVNICIKYLGDRDTGMAIVDAGIFSGFKPNEDDLSKLQESPSNLIDRYEVSNRGIVFYLAKTRVQEPYCFNFRIVREYIVGNIQPSIIKVYDYYNPDASCSEFYSDNHNSPLLRQICSNGICQCAEGGCPPKKPFGDGRIDRDNLKLSACEDHDYVWKGRVIGQHGRKDGFLHIKFQIDDVLKGGVEKAELIEGETRILMARDNCESAELFPGQDYLIMGKDGEKYQDDNGELRHRYLLDKTTKIHVWQNPAAGKVDRRQRAFNWLRTELKNNGCDL